MAEETKGQGGEVQQSKFPFMIIIGVVVLAAAIVGGVLMTQGGSELPEQQPPAEYQVKSKMYQLKDGSYLKLAFSIVVDADKVPTIQQIVEKDMPGRMPSGITMVLGNKTREDLISGTYKREAFARELKKMLEERVFGDYNKRQTASKDMIEVREVLISDFVTQAG